MQADSCIDVTGALPHGFRGLPVCSSVKDQGLMEVSLIPRVEDGEI